MKNYTISRNIITKQMINDNQNYFLTGWRRTLITLCSAFGFAFAVTAFLTKDYIQTVLMLAVAVFGIWELYFITSRKKKELLKTYGNQEELTFSLSFGNESFTVLNVNTKANTRIFYTDIVKIDETKEGYVIVTKNDGFIIINNDALPNGITELNDYLKAQGVKLSRWPK